jgi:hypothetical protein
MAVILDIIHHLGFFFSKYNVSETGSDFFFRYKGGGGEERFLSSWAPLNKLVESLRLEKPTRWIMSRIIVMIIVTHHRQKPLELTLTCHFPSRLSNKNVLCIYFPSASCMSRPSHSSRSFVRLSGVTVLAGSW